MALQEQAFGINSFVLMQYSRHDARARVILFEGTIIDVVLNIRGYQVSFSSCEAEKILSACRLQLPS